MVAEFRHFIHVSFSVNKCMPVQGCGPGREGDVFFRTVSFYTDGDSIWKISHGTSATAVEAVTGVSPGVDSGIAVLKLDPFRGHLIAEDTVVPESRIFRAGHPDFDPADFITLDVFNSTPSGLAVILPLIEKLRSEL